MARRGDTQNSDRGTRSSRSSGSGGSSRTSRSSSSRSSSGSRSGSRSSGSSRTSSRDSGSRSGSSRGGSRSTRSSDSRSSRSSRGSERGSSRSSSRGSSRTREQAPRWSSGSQSQAEFAPNSNRAFIPLVLFAVVAVIFLCRLVYLQVIMSDTYSQMAEESRTVQIVTEARRGTIYDRNGTILAISVDAASVYANPAEIEDADATAEAIAEVLDGDADDYMDALTSDSSSYAAVEQKIDVEDGEAIEELSLDGIYVVEDTRREYPCGEVGGQIIGACSIGVDEESGTEYYYGISGLEEYYDDVLSGTDGYYEAERGADGTPIPGGLHEEVEAVDGQDIVISIDIELQEYVEEALTEGLADLGTDDGTAIVMDGGTGEIYAAASLPLFDPSDRSVVEEGATSLKCVTDLFEPGSMFKTVSATALLEEDVMTPETEVYCPSSITADDYVITDSHDREDTTMTLAQIIAQSSNVGISLSVSEMGFDKLYEAIERYNFTELTGVDYPGEQLGYLLDYDEWSTVTGYNVSFGQGLSVTPLQMVRFYGALVNDGVECTPHFLLSLPQTGEEMEYDTEQVIEDQEDVDDMVEMLEGVVTEGTGTAAAIEGYTVAGKTSTAEIYDEENGGYLEDTYYLGFTGFLVDSSSQLVCFVGANEVSGTGVVTPIFQDIMTKAIERFDITS